MKSIQGRARTLIDLAGMDALVREGAIGHARWKNVRHKNTRISSEELDVLVSIYPQYALWLASGTIAPECGNKPRIRRGQPKLDQSKRGIAITQKAGQRWFARKDKEKLR